MNTKQKALYLLWFPVVLSVVFVCVYLTQDRFMFGYGCEKSAFTPNILAYSLNHGNEMHITFNIIALVYFSAYITYVYGNIITILIYTTSVIGAALAYYGNCRMSAEKNSVIGASGGISGLTGATLVIALYHMVQVSKILEDDTVSVSDKMSCCGIGLLQLLCVMVLIVIDVSNILLSENSRVAHFAHIGGFATGVILCGMVTIANHIKYARDG